MANVMTPEFRVSWPKVFKPELNKLNGKMEYSLVALFPKGADLSALKAAAQEAIIKKWGADKAAWPAKLKTPFRDQGEKEKLTDGRLILPAGYEKGAIFITLKSTQKPGVVDASVQDIINEHEFYSGCWARATVNAFTYSQLGNMGVSFGLQNLQKTKEGEPLSGRMKAENEFAPVAGSQEVVVATSTDLFS